MLKATDASLALPQQQTLAQNVAKDQTQKQLGEIRVVNMEI